MKRVHREVVWEGKLFDVVVERWGERGEREIVEHGGSVTIVPVDRDGRIVMTRQFREVAEGELLELPAGMRDEGEEPLACARRELAEETGLHGGSWRELRTITPSPGILREPVTVFVVEGLEEGERNLDEAEKIELVRLTREQAERAVGEIADAKTLVGLLLYLRETR